MEEQGYFFQKEGQGNSFQEEGQGYSFQKEQERPERLALSVAEWEEAPE